MALFFFDIDDGSTSFADTEGYEAEDLAAARSMGIRALQESMRDNVDHDATQTVLHMTILDAERLPLWVLSLTLSSAEPPSLN